MSGRHNMVACALAGLGLTALLSSSAGAAMVNPGFETGDLTGWTLVSSGGWGSGATVTDNVADQSSQYPKFGASLPGTAEGTHYAQLAGNSGTFSYLYQDVGALEPNTTYVLTIAIGVTRFDYSLPAATIYLINGTNQTGTALASANTSTLGFGIYAGDFKDLATEAFTTGSTVAGDLVIAIGSDGFPHNSTSLDNVRLTATAVPEPGMLGLVGAASLLLGGRRRRMA
jgi:hypothetical protein